MRLPAKLMKLTHHEPDNDSEWFTPTTQTDMGLRYVDRDGDLVAITLNRTALLTAFTKCGGPATQRVDDYDGQIREFRPGETFTLSRR